MAMVEESAKYIQMSPDKADPIQLFMRLQIAFSDQFPQFVIMLWRLRNIAMSARSRRLRRVLLRHVYTFLYAIASQSSVRGQFIKILHTRQENIALLTKDLKNPSLRERLFERKQDQMQREEMQGFEG